MKSCSKTVVSLSQEMFVNFSSYFVNVLKKVVFGNNKDRFLSTQVVRDEMDCISHDDLFCSMT